MSSAAKALRNKLCLYSECSFDKGCGCLEAIDEALAAERERCALLAEAFPEKILQMWDRPGGPPGNGWRPSTFKDIASAIRNPEN